MNKKAPFITVEGIDGAGKSTLIAGLVQHLEETKTTYRKLSMLPEGGIRKEVLTNPFLSLKHRLLLIATAGNLALDETSITTANGNLVIMDRGLDSFYAYQGHGSRLMKEVNLVMAELYPPPITPDLTFFIDVDPDESKRRLAAAGKEKDIIENFDEEFHWRVYLGFKERIMAEPDRFHVLEGDDKPKLMLNKAILRLEWLFETTN